MFQGTFLMNISILTADFSSNCYGRSYLLAKLLQSYHNVKVIGPQFGETIWSPLANSADINIVPVTIPYRTVNFIESIIEITKQCNSEIIYATKPLVTSFGVGILAKIKYGKPLILDIDDWELAPFYIPNALRRMKNAMNDINKPISFFPTYIMEKLVRFADFTTVASSVLKRKFGGMIIPHVRRIPHYQKKVVDDKNITIMFLGTPRPHKGLEDLIAAFRLLENNNVILKIIGVDPNEYYCEQISEIAEKDSRINLMSFVPFDSLGDILFDADIIVIPQRSTFVGETQTPAKLFDAMAYGKAIVSTRVSDIPEVLDDCGLIVKPANIDDLYKALKFLIENPRQRMVLGKKAQDRCATVYNYDSVAQKLSQYIEEAACPNT